MPCADRTHTSEGRKKEVHLLNRCLMLTVLLALILAACGPQPVAEQSDTPTSAVAETSSTEETTTGEGMTEGELTVDRSRLSSELYFFNWTDYLDPSILEDFEEEYGVRVTEDFFDSNENLLAKMRAGNSGYDIVAPSDYAVKIMSAEKLIAPLDKTLLPNMRHLNPDLLNLYFDPDNTYSVPYFWGTTGIAYNEKFFDTPPDSWAALFDSANLQEISGRFTMLDDSRETPGAALRYLGASVNTTDTQKLQAAQQLLLDQKSSVAAYDSANYNLKLATEEIIIAHGWGGTAAQARQGVGDKPGNPNIQFLIPEEGGVIWMDNLAIVDDSPNAYTAHVFINYLLRPDIAARNADYVLFLTPNQDAEEMLSEATRDIYNAGVKPDAETMERLEWIQRTPQTDTLYNDLWTRVVSS